jgi:hypothetical protein
MSQRFNIILDDISVTKLNELAAEFNMLNPKGEMQFTNTIKAIIGYTHKKTFPVYVQVAKSRPTPEEKEARRADILEQREIEKEQRTQKQQEELCLMMDEASVVNHPETGRPACHYPIYTTASPHIVDKTWVHEDLMLLNEETPSLQYHGLYNAVGEDGKQEVLERLKKIEAMKEGKNVSLPKPASPKGK